jgi:tetratricopeptide (TPR) repeat protein
MSDVPVTSARLTEAETLITLGQHKAAHALCLAELADRSDNPQALYLLGVISNEHAAYAKGAELLKKSLEGGDEPRAHAQLARALSHLHRPNEAREAAEKALASGASDAHTLDTIGVVLSRAGLHEQALEPFSRATALTPDNGSFQFNYAASLQFSGRFAEAEAAYRRAFALDDTAFRALAAIPHLRKQNSDDNLVDDLTRAFSRTTDATQRLHLGHALAKTFEDLGDYQQSLRWLIAAKDGVKNKAAIAAPRDQALFAAAARTVGPAAKAGGGDAIFVVGLPRTGTTLTERILTSHPEIKAAGELGDFGLLIKRAAKTPSQFVLDAETFDAAARVDLGAVGQAYLQSVAQRIGAGRFVDKMPLNALYAGLILRALPDARIICLKRNPMDACLSNYRQLLAGAGASSYDYTFTLETTAVYYAGFERLTAHWRAHLPADRYTEVQYEDLVADLETQARQLTEFVGVAWDPRCIAFHENTAPVATASSVQVRSPLYASAIGRWRRYGEALNPLRKALEAHGVKIED